MARSRPPLPALLLAMLLAGCAAVPHDEPASVALEGGHLGLTDPGQAGNAGIAVPVATDWWRTMGDPQLDRIMTDALAGNPDLAQAQARIRLAEAQLAANRAGQLPQVGIDADEQRERLSEKYIIPPPYGGSTVWMGSAQANLSWSADLAGKQAAMVDQARASTSAAALDAAAARVSLTGAVAQAYLNLVRADRQIAIAREFRETREESLRLVRSRIANQLASTFDERSAQTLLGEARQAEIRAQGDRELLVHALAALAGRGADYYPTIVATSLALDSALPVPEAVPADLLGRRPDLLAGQVRIAAASAGRRVARADFFPNVNLKAFIGFQAIGLDSLFTGSALTYGGGPAIHVPIFEGGALRANYRGATAQIDTAVDAYNAQVLTAVREAADALSAIRTAEADAAEQRNVLASLSDTVRLDATRVRTGLGSRLDAIASGERLLQARQAQVNIDADAAVRRVQLLVALGGDFDPMGGQSAANTVSAGARP